jgi:hypothetical protein
MSAVSSTFRAHCSMHSEKTAISLSWKVYFSNLGSLVIVFRSGTWSDPCISSVATAIMITTSNSSVKRSGTPNQFSRVRLHTIPRFGSLDQHECCSALLESRALETGSSLIPHSCVRFAWPVHSEGFPAADITRAGSPQSHLWPSRDSEIHCERRLQSKRHWSAKIA